MLQIETGRDLEIIFVKKCKIGYPSGDFEIMEKKSD
jgi:hypothetical protein